MKEGIIHQLGGEKAWDSSHRENMLAKTTAWQKASEEGRRQFSDLDLAKSRASLVREHVIFKLENYLKDFESRFTNSGGKVIWAPTAREALEAVMSVIDKHKVEVVVKAQSATTEEIGLKQHIRRNGSSVYETSLGDFIVDLAGESPGHFSQPSVHLNKNQVQNLFQEKQNLPQDSPVEDISDHVRNLLRKKYAVSGLAVTGASFLLANSGSVVITEEEGNAFLMVAKPKVHVVIAGIDKILPGPEDLSLFLPLLASYSSGKSMNTYSHIISAPEKERKGGRTEMIVILLDNGRSRILEDEKLRPILKCIHCGACLNVCPVYQNLGGHAWGTTYQGPFGSVFEPARHGMEKHAELPFASTLCGKCTEICPVNIDLRKMLLYARKNVVEKRREASQDRRTIKGFKYIMYRRKRLEKGYGLRRMMLKWSEPKYKGALRVSREPEHKSFARQWEDREGTTS